MSYSIPNLGQIMAERLGLTIVRREGHDLAGPCIACSSSDAFKIHQQTGVAHCFSCGRSWSPYQTAEIVLGDKAQARDLMVELGVFSPSSNGQSGASANPIITIARQKGISAESLVAFGAKEITPKAIGLPAYGPDGTPCTTFKMFTDGGKGLFEKDKPAGLFFPHENGVVRLPKPGETWHIVEGPKDAAALHGIGLLACGLNTCRLAAKFGRFFVGVNVILIPDRDRAGEVGAQHSARVLRGIAKSVHIAVLPAEFKESQGEDVRDVLRRPAGRQQVEQAIADAQPAFAETGNSAEQGDADAPGSATTQIELPEGASLTLTVHPPDGRPQRRVVISRGDFEHRDRIDINSSMSRGRLTKQLAAKLNMNCDQLAALVEPQLMKLSDKCDDLVSSIGAEDDVVHGQATLAANMAADWELFHTPGNDAFVTIPVGNHVETWPVKSQRFKRFVAKQFYDRQGKAMNSEALSSAINLIEAKALFEGEEHPVHVRVAEHNGNVYLDLCNEDWQVVEITADGWHVIDDSPVKFRRSKGMLPLPTPVAGGSVDELRKFLNVDETIWPLVIAWLVAALRPRGPYPLLALFADQGSGKSTVGRFLRSLIDPNSAPLRAEPKDGHNLMIAANNSWVLGFDNLSHLPPWLSDALCRMSTGGGFATRELYSDQDEIIFDSQRPALLTSIEEVATRSDLLDRCVIIWLPTIPEERRRPEAQLIAEFEAARPRILGALLDAISAAIRNLPTVQLPCLPRMADFAIWVTAAEAGLGWLPGTFHKAYQSNRDSANDLALESSPIGRPLLEHLENNDGWSGTSSELLEILRSNVLLEVTHQRGWPKDARALSGQLKRISPNLRNLGWSIDSDRTSKRRQWTIQRMTQQPEPSIPGTSSSGDQSTTPTDELSMQSDADPDNWPHGDAYDGDDAIPPTDGQPPMQHGDGDKAPF